tara:strand:+ start:151 stop:477 length:327 start_codon:yes stop_codon:yes gene_type:complete
MTDFPCTSCGLCCKNISSMYSQDHSPIMQFLVDKFPYKTLEDGSCEMLKDNQCSVYEDRPLICNVRLGGKLLGIDQDIWYAYLADGCNELIKDAGLDEKYLVSLEKMT